MKNNRGLSGLKRALVGMTVLCLCAVLMMPVLSFGAYAEGGTVVEVLDENGQIVEMGDGDAQVILEDPALIEDDPVDEEQEEAQNPAAISEPTVGTMPETTEQPQATAEPEATTEPEATVSPDPTDEPTSEPTEEPEITPEPTDEPETTPLPSIAPTDGPTTHPTISPEATDEPASVPAYSIQIAAPTGWSGAESEKVRIYIEDKGGTGWQKIEIRLAGGEWVDAVGASGGSADLNVDVKRNGLLVVRITDPSGEYHSEQTEITCFDRNAPEVTAGVNDQMLHVETSDGQSGVAGIQVNGLLFTTLENGKLDVRIMELLASYKKLVVRAYDYAGNFSDTVTIDNPYYVEEEQECPTPKPTKKPSGSGSSSKATPKPKATATPTAAPTATPIPMATAVPTVVPAMAPTMMPVATATPTVVTQYIPLGPGQPYMKDGNMQTLDMLYSAATNKQFITVQTRKGETYYLVIDYDKPIDEEAEIYETYFLNLVDDRDLLSVLSEDEIPAPTPTPVVIYATPEPTAVPPMQPVEQDDSADKMMALFALVMIVLVGGGAALWFFKFRDSGKKNGKLDEDYEFDEDEEEYDEDM